MPAHVLPRFAPATRTWFTQAFTAPTTAQTMAWTSIARGEHTLVIAPTGSGKTLAAFLWSIDRLMTTPHRPNGTSVLYISPLKALAVDIERNLRSPLTGIRRIDPNMPDITVGVRTGDTPANERRRLLAHPPDILITTPESLYLMLTSAARETLADVNTVIVDEVHAVAGGKRGTHLALSLERLARITDDPQRIGLSATVKPPQVVAEFLGGDRPVNVVQAPVDKQWDLRVRVPLEDLANPPVITVADPSDEESPAQNPSVWPHVENAILDAIEAHESTLVFTNSRRLSERLTNRLNELWLERQGQSVAATPARTPPAELMGAAGSTFGASPVLARAHHGSVSKERRKAIEDDLKAGRLRAVVATSSLELGIDMGAIDLVIQVQAPPGVSSGLQRVGRAGHQVGAVSRALIYPTHRGDLLAAAVTIGGMEAGDLEPIRPPRHPLDVLAQQLIAMTSMDEWDVDELYALVRRARPYAELPRSAYEAVLDMLAGRYPTESFAALKPRIVWDRQENTIVARPGAQRIAVTSGGTIPDRGHYGVFLIGGDANTRVGELDEEMVYESRVGDVFALGSSSWRIEDITADRVLVTPAPGQPARLPFWHGDAIGRPAELGRALGEFLDEYQVNDLLPGHLDANAGTNLTNYLSEQIDATGGLPGARTILIEQFRDELGDRRVVIHSPYGARVHAPWALILTDRLQQTYGIDAQVMPADDGLVLRLPDDGSLESLPTLVDLVSVAAPQVSPDVTRLVGGSALFASRFRECAARSLLFPRRDPTRRSPLWQQRQRSAQLLSVASGFDSFPVVLETVRECLQDVYDVPALTDLMTRIERGEVAISEVTTRSPSPFARSLLFGYVAAFLYEGDSPLAERKSAALALDDALLTELLGTADLRELLSEQALETVEQRLQRLGDRAATTTEQAWDIVREIGPLRLDECEPRGITPEARSSLLKSRRVFGFRHDDQDWLAVIEDAARLRDGLGIALPIGLPESLLALQPHALGELIQRYARCHGPFTTEEVAHRYGLAVAAVLATLRSEANDGRLLSGAFRPWGTTTEWCHPDSLRAIRRVSAAQYRDEIEPVDQLQFATFLPDWQGVSSSVHLARHRGRDGLLTVIDQLAGCPLPASTLDTQILDCRVRDYSPALLDELTSSGDVTWWGVAPLARDGWVCLSPADVAAELLPVPGIPDLPIDIEVLAVLSAGGGWFADQILARLEHTDGLLGNDIIESLWRLVWGGHLTNDTLAPLRLLGSGSRSRTTSVRRRRLTPRAGTGRGLGRWSVLPTSHSQEAGGRVSWADSLLQRYGLVTRGSVAAERQSFSLAYRALSGVEDRGLCRRGYIVDGLGGAQFGLPTAIDQIRGRRDDTSPVHVLAAADPANPYGAALPWPDFGTTANPGRKAGATVLMVGGELALYVEKGGSSVLHRPGFDPDLAPAMVAAVRDRRIGPLSIRRINGAGLDHPFANALIEHGAHLTPSGLKVRP